MSESEVTETDGVKVENSPRKRVRHRKKRLYDRILKQMQFYFSDANLTKDRFLGDLVKSEPYVPIETFLKFNRIRLMTTDVSVIAKAIKNSTFLELSEDKLKDSIRGALTSTTASGYFLGLLFSYILGGHLTYHQVVYVHLTGSVLYILLVAALKESPVFLMQRGKEKEAAQSVAFYRHVAVTSKEVEVEIAKLKLQLDPRIDTILSADKDPASKQLINTNPKEQNNEV